MERNKLSEEEKATIKNVMVNLFSFVMDEIKIAGIVINKDASTRERVAELAANMKSAFYWEDTEEGYDYWADVYNRLRRIAEKGF